MKPRTRWMGLAALVALVVVGLVAYRARVTADRVQVTIRNLPENTYFACLVVDSGKSLQPIEWLPYPNYRPIHPKKAIVSFPRDRDIGIEFETFIRWREGVRYGLVMLGRDAEWRVLWYDARVVRVVGRSPVWGRGSVDFDASQGRPVLFTDAEVEAAGVAGAYL